MPGGATGKALTCVYKGGKFLATYFYSMLQCSELFASFLKEVGMRTSECFQVQEQILQGDTTN